MVLLVVLVAALVLWRHSSGHQKLASIATSVAGHGTAAALGVLAAVFVGAMLVTWTRATAQALGLLALVILGAGAAGGLYLYGIESLDSVNATSGQVKKAESLLTKLGKPGAPAVALIAGYDHRSGTGTNAYAGSNSDTLMLLRADPKNDTLSLLSFPRDLNVPIYCKGNTIATYDRINTAWANCGSNGGPYAAVDTIQHLAVGVHVNYLITLDFNAFKEVVNRLHGVYINIDRRYYNPLGTGYSAINLQPGYQKLDGGQALQYVRFRHLDSDIYRNGRQQLFMEALKARLSQTLTLSNFGEILQIIHAVKGNLEIAKSDGSPPSITEINSYLGLLLGLPPGHLQRNAIPPQDLVNFVTPAGADELKASPEAVAAAVHSFLHPVVPKVHRGHKTRRPKLPYKTISALVLNAGDITGEAANTSTALRRHGFVTKTLPKSTPANAPSTTHDTVVYYDPSQANAQKAARELAPLFGPHNRVTQMTPAIAPFAGKAGNPLTVVAIGTAYHGTLKFPRRGGGPSSSTANAQVQDGIGFTLPAVRSENGPAHFPLMVPHKVALGSSLSTDEGVRLFHPVPGKQELVLTFNLNGGVEYWQVEESNWTYEPLFAKPTDQFTYKGLTYKEFTTGGLLQTIAVYAGRNVYWVQNTILNSLSNSTMIAIAKGLRPLH
ncbi:MAG TPA: LCP family protein [Gaiellaceae bacterium]|nr:LCP family protein [Gaiellaceae bacterium]